MKNLKKILALLMASVMMFSMVACSVEKEDAQPAPSAEAETEAEAEATEEAPKRKRGNK